MFSSTQTGSDGAAVGGRSRGDAYAGKAVLDVNDHDAAWLIVQWVTPEQVTIESVA